MRRLIWGTLLIVAAILIILSSLNVELGFIGLLPVSNIMLGAVIIAVSVCFIYDKTWSLLPYSLALLFFIFEDEIAESAGLESSNIISNWTVFGCAVLLSIGIVAISSSVKKHRIKEAFDRDSEGSKSGSRFSEGTKFGNEIKYIDCSTFKNYYYKLFMASGEICFENIDKYEGGGTITVNCKMSELVINVPASWKVESKISAKIGETKIPLYKNESGPVLIIDGENNMSEIEIRYY